MGFHVAKYTVRPMMSHGYYGNGLKIPIPKSQADDLKSPTFGGQETHLREYQGVLEKLWNKNT